MNDDAVRFSDDLGALGFQLVQESRTGVMQLSRKESRYLTYWVHWTPGDETVLFTWELAVGEMMDDLGLQIGSNEPLNQFLFPKYDARGPQQIAFVVQEIERAEQVLGSVDLLSAG